ncbi:HPr family phosphocarrier protein [Bartonella sp. HY329]|uniref:HPr family phosphocarrier protein n=1 Tax=unclassified Bartonella TaxID=2645622 RepID=UPI0021C61FB0|nr:MULTISPECIES: HPr family phosphocarrier protein [unclassified Bartonella]UXM95683.1 HPr family phosphocarrier protein [Bartonella sp. HY329]UXN10008.1 HPr family phosphocarrier protein [Bartonella sp. HY328]
MSQTQLSSPLVFAEQALSREIGICNKRGLHARASAKFVKLVGSFSADVRVEKDGMSVGGTSIMGLMMLAASPGCKITVIASGDDANAVLDAIEELVNERFGEEC